MDPWQSLQISTAVIAVVALGLVITLFILFYQPETNVTFKEVGERPAGKEGQLKMYYRGESLFYVTDDGTEHQVLAVQNFTREEQERQNRTATTLVFPQLDFPADDPVTPRNSVEEQDSELIRELEETLDHKQVRFAPKRSSALSTEQHPNGLVSAVSLRREEKEEIKGGDEDLRLSRAVSGESDLEEEGLAFAEEIEEDDGFTSDSTIIHTPVQPKPKPTAVWSTQTNGTVLRPGQMVTNAHDHATTLLQFHPHDRQEQAVDIARLNDCKMLQLKTQWVQFNFEVVGIQATEEVVVVMLKNGLRNTQNTRIYDHSHLRGK